MSKLIGFIADVHIGNHQRHDGKLEAGINRRCDLTLDTLQLAADTCHREGCNVLTVAGDLFHSDKVTPQIEAEVQKIIPHDEDAATILVSGNHDQTSYTTNDHALGPQQDCLIVDKPSVHKAGFDTELLCIPYRTGNVASWLPEELDKMESSVTTRVLVAHFGVIDPTTPDYLQRQPDAIAVDTLGNICNEFDIKFAMIGHWHDRKVWIRERTTIIQLGALCPTGYNNPGFDYGFITFLDTKTLGITVRHVAGPRFFNIHKAVWTSEYQAKFAEARKKGCKIYLTMTTHPKNVVETLKNLEHAVELGTYEGIDVLPLHEEAKEEARAAARATRKAETLIEALTAFTGKMPMEEGVKRKNVLGRSKGYLNV